MVEHIQNPWNGAIPQISEFSGGHWTSQTNPHACSYSPCLALNVPAKWPYWTNRHAVRGEIYCRCRWVWMYSKYNLHFLAHHTCIDNYIHSSCQVVVFSHKCYITKEKKGERTLRWTQTCAKCVLCIQSNSQWQSLSVFQWQLEAQEYCPSAKLVLVGCKLDMRTDVGTLRELSKQRLIPVTHEQVNIHTCTKGIETWRCEMKIMLWNYC